MEPEGVRYAPVSVNRLLISTRRNAGQVRLLLWDALQVSCVLVLLAWLCLWLSALLFGCFYFSFLPKVSFHVPIHLVYFSDCHDTPSTTPCPSHTHYCRNPTAQFSLVHNESLQPFLVQGQQYQLLLHLEMPENEVNQRVGLFMVHMQIQEGNKTVFTVQRSASLRYKSDLLSSLETLALLPYYIGGYRHQCQLLTVDLGLVTPPNARLDRATVTLQSRDVMVTSASFLGLAKFSGVRYWLYFYPVTVALLSIVSLFACIYPLLVLAYLRWRHIMPTYLDLEYLSTLANVGRGEEIDRPSVVGGEREGRGDLETVDDRGCLEAEEGEEEEENGGGSDSIVRTRGGSNSNSTSCSNSVVSNSNPVPHLPGQVALPDCESRGSRPSGAAAGIGRARGGPCRGPDSTLCRVAAARNRGPPDRHRDAAGGPAGPVPEVRGAEHGGLLAESCLPRPVELLLRAREPRGGPPAARHRGAGPLGPSRPGHAAPDVELLVQRPGWQGDDGHRSRHPGEKHLLAVCDHDPAGRRHGPLAPEPAPECILHAVLGARGPGAAPAAALQHDAGRARQPDARLGLHAAQGAPQGGQQLDRLHPDLWPGRPARPGLLQDGGRLRGAHPRGCALGVCHHPALAERRPRVAVYVVCPRQRAGPAQAVPEHGGAAPDHLRGRGADALERHLHPDPRAPLPHQPRRPAVRVPAGRAAAHDGDAARGHVAADAQPLVAHRRAGLPAASQPAGRAAGRPLLPVHVCGGPVDNVARAFAAREARLWQPQQGADAASVVPHRIVGAGRMHAPAGASAWGGR